MHVVSGWLAARVRRSIRSLTACSSIVAVEESACGGVPVCLISHAQRQRSTTLCLTPGPADVLYACVQLADG